VLLAAEAQEAAKQYRIGLLIAYPYNTSRAISRVFVPALGDYPHDARLEEA
jgi:hypothetical protein